MLRRILIPLDNSPFTEAALSWSCYAAKITGAELTGLTVLDIPGIERSIGSVPVGGIQVARCIVDTKEQKALEHIKKLLENFESTCKKSGVRYSLAERQGNPSDQIIKDSIFYDLVVIGLRTNYHYDADDKRGESVEHIMGHSVSPILAVPDRFEKPTGKINVIVAFDGSLPSARALHRFAQIVRTAEYSVTILMSHQDMEFANRCLDGAETFLISHDFKHVKKKWTTANILDEIRENYLENTNLIVLGAHSKSILTDFMVGSLSKSLMRQENKYLLIGQ